MYILLGLIWEHSLHLSTRAVSRLKLEVDELPLEHAAVRGSDHDNSGLIDDTIAGFRVRARIAQRVHDPEIFGFVLVHFERQLEGAEYMPRLDFVVLVGALDYFDGLDLVAEYQVMRQTAGRHLGGLKLQSLELFDVLLDLGNSIEVLDYAQRALVLRLVLFQQQLSLYRTSVHESSSFLQFV